VDDGVGLTDIAEELVAQTFSFAGSLHQSGYIHDVACGRNDTPGVDQFRQFVRHGDLSHLCINGTERKVCSLCLGTRQTVEKGRLAHVGQTYYTCF
jgi:hypothetical protein